MSPAPSHQTQSCPSHIPRLDVVRAIAILLVLGMHFLSYGAGIYDAGRWNGAFRDYSYWPLHDFYLLTPLTLGGIGVTLFFVLSGFCIHYSFLRRPQSFSTADFYWRRFLRIYPAYIAALLVFIGVAWAFHYEPFGAVTFTQVWTHLFLVHDLSRSTLYGIAGSFWSLAVEFQFYLAYPLLLVGMRRFTLRGCMILALLINVFCQIFILFSTTGLTNTHGFLWSFPLMTWWTWILGACVAESYVLNNSVFERRFLIIITGLLFWVFAFLYRPLEGNNALFGGVVCAALMETYLKYPKPLGRLERLLIPVGLISYSLYLWHHPLMHPIYNLFSKLSGFDSPSTLKIILCLFFNLLLLFPLAAISYFLFEVKAQRLIQHLASYSSSKASLLNEALTS